MKIAAYVYTGWHSVPERDEGFRPGFTEWDLVEACRPRFEGHRQPRVPLLGSYDDRDPIEAGRRLALAASHGVDAFVYGFFWCRGKRVFEAALDRGYLGSVEGNRLPFALMWANRMPRRVLPVRRSDLPVIDGSRRVPSDVDDFVSLIKTLAEDYFHRPNYLTVEGRSYFSIYDSTFFLRELGLEGAKEAIARARRWLSESAYPDLHLVAIDPSLAVVGDLRDIGFDSVTHYVFLPDWRGPALQDYRERAGIRADEWERFSIGSKLPYVPSVSPGWDASPRAAEFGAEKPSKYPWSPVVTGDHPDLFHEALVRAAGHANRSAVAEPMVMVASLNEWSEGHYIEPDTRFENGWLEAIRAARD